MKPILLLLWLSVRFTACDLPAASTGSTLPVDTYRYDTFLGWSEDGSYYGRTSAGRDGVARAELCRSDGANADTATWPAWLDRPGESACTPLCAAGADCREASERADRLLVVPEWGRVGPHEEEVKVRSDGERADVIVECRGQVIAEKSVAVDGPIAAADLLGITWRPDGGAVAVLIPTPAPPDYQLAEAPEPPAYLAVLTVPPRCRPSRPADPPRPHTPSPTSRLPPE